MLKLLRILNLILADVVKLCLKSLAADIRTGSFKTMKSIAFLQSINLVECIKLPP